MTAKFERSGSEGVITLENDLTLPYAEEMRSVLIKALIDAEKVRVSFGSVTAVDLSCMQLLCSAIRSSVRLNKQLSFAGATPDILKHAVKAAGYSRVMGCKLGCEKTCIWIAMTGTQQ